MLTMIIIQMDVIINWSGNQKPYTNLTETQNFFVLLYKHDLKAIETILVFHFVILIQN